MKLGVVYKITNTKNNKSYIGQTISTSRWRGHKHALNKDTHKNPHLQSAWNKYGSSFFTYEVLEDGIPEEKNTY